MLVRELMDDSDTGDGTAAVPFLEKNRPQPLVVVFPVVKERAPQLAFAHGAHFSKGAIATAVLDGHTRFQSVRADGREYEIARQARAVEPVSVGNRTSVETECDDWKGRMPLRQPSGPAA
jgi:hypothetical protein